jgi:beta-lactamase regulating signal transducer with metallopeptidase domain
MEELFLKVLNMSITATYVLIAVLVLRLLLKRVSKWISYSLWSLVLFRLVCPISLSSAFSIFGRLGKAASTGSGIEHIPMDIGMMAAPLVDIGVTSANTVINHVLPAATPAASVNPMQILLFIGTCIWLAGFALMLIYSVISYLRLKNRMREATLLSGNVFVTDKIASPFVCGLIKPKIYLPFGLSENERDYVLRHEKTHIARRDHLIKPLAFFVLSVHWFNPFIWLAFILMSRDLEMSCDEKVVSKLDPEGKAGYSTALVHLAIKRPILAGSPLAFGESGAKGRVKNVLNYKKPAFWVLVIAVAAVVLAALCLLTNPSNTSGLLDVASPKIINAPAPAYAFDEFPDSNGGMITNKVDIPFNEYISKYSGYLDEVALFDTAYDNKDYDGDGKNDRIRRNIVNSDINEATTKIGYTVEFGNGDALKIGDFDDAFTGIRLTGEDLTGDGINEIIFIGAHGSSTFPPSSSEIAVFQKDNDGYKILPLPRTDNWKMSYPPQEYKAGFSVYIKDIAGDKVTFYTSKFHFEETVIIEDKDTLQFFKLIGIDGEVGSEAWQVQATTYNGAPALAMYINIGSKYYLRNLIALLTWQSGEFLPIAMGLEKEQELLSNADLDRNEKTEAIYLDKSQIKEGLVTLRVLNETGTELCSEQLSTSHAGWDSLFLYELDGKQYLLRYSPGMYQGYCTYTYTLFTLDGGKEKVFRTNTLEFDINGAKALDAPEMVTFAEEVNALLGKSTLLVSTDGGTYSFGLSSAEPFFERYSWLDDYPKLYTSGDNLETCLEKYSDYAISNRKISEDSTYTVTDREVASAKKAALSYYENNVFKGRITNISQMTDISKVKSAVIPYRIKDIVTAFYVTMSDNAKRMIILTKEKSGEWEVINEGI